MSLARKRSQPLEWPWFSKHRAWWIARTLLVILAVLGAWAYVLAVPNDAVRRDRTGRPVVKVLRNGRWQPVVVETGLTDGHYTEVTGGGRAGETVQVRPDLV